MTAEIAILNKMAVALAADSKVTVGPQGSEKTYDTVNKLFTLSKYHPVGIMIYGNAEFMQYPWETIIKQYRDSIQDQEKSTVQVYANDFLKHLTSKYRYTKVDNETNVRSILLSFYELIYNKVYEEYISTNDDSEGESREIDNILEDIIKKSLSRLAKEDDLDLYNKHEQIDIGIMAIIHLTNLSHIMCPPLRNRGLDSA